MSVITKHKSQLLMQSSGAPHPLRSMQKVETATTYSRPSINRLIAQEGFPRPIELGGNAFFADEIAASITSRERALPNAAAEADRSNPHVTQDGRS